jgi:transcriptional regulator with XRE-family HTH domain
MADSPSVGKKSEADKHVEDRIRAHVRQQMDERGIDAAEVSRRTGVDDGLLSRVLSGERGIGFATLLKFCDGLKITPTRILETDPPAEYWAPDDRPGPPRDKKTH